MHSKRKCRSYGVFTFNFSSWISKTKAARSAHQGPEALRNIKNGHHILLVDRLILAIITHRVYSKNTKHETQRLLMHSKYYYSQDILPILDTQKYVGLQNKS